MNEQFGEKVKAIFDSITILQAKDSDLKRDNANINGDSPMGAAIWCQNRQGVQSGVFD